MLGLLKRVSNKIGISSDKDHWSPDDTKFRILIRLNNYFTESKWSNCFQAHIDLVPKNIEIVFVHTREAFLKHFSKADACFMFDYKNDYSQWTDGKKLLYIPTQGLDILDNKYIPQSFTVVNPPAFSAKAIAEYCTAMVIMLNRRLQYAISAQSKIKWNQRPILKNDYSSVKNKTVGLMGVGKVGSEIAASMKFIGCKVLGLDKLSNENIENIEKWFLPNQIEDFLQEIDILIIALPLNTETKGIIGYHELKMLGKESSLINISRGEIIIENDLLRALQERIIEGAVLDVFAQEPLTSRSPFYRLDNVILTPHIAGNINLFVEIIQNDFLSKIISLR